MCDIISNTEGCKRVSHIYTFILNILNTMGFASGNTEQKDSGVEKYTKMDNVKDITQIDLKKLKTELKPEMETDIDSKLNEINTHVETYFDGFISKNREKSITLNVNGVQITDTVSNIVASEDESKLAKLNALANEVINQVGYEKDILAIKDIEIQKALREYKFELNDVWNSVKENSTGGTGEKRNTSSDNVLVNDMGVVNKAPGTQKTTKKGTEKKEATKNIETKKYEPTNDYIDKYKQTSYASASTDIENINRDNKLAKAMEKIFDNEDGKELRRGTFRINLGKENGLAGIIISIREAIENKDNQDTNNKHKQLYDKLVANRILRSDGGTIDLEFSRSDLKDLLDSKDFVYERKGGLDDEKRKIAKILSSAQWNDLDTFASLVQSKDSIPRAVKERNNTLEMTGQNREKTEKGTQQTSLVNTDNVLNFLCDFNSDGEISAEYKRKNNKEQRNQGDVGPLFGQQVMFTIEQAIKVKSVELGNTKGEQLVISNIIKNMTIADSRSLANTHLISMRNDASKCTKENLAKLINGSTGYGTESIYPMPEMKIFFLDAIRKINGGSKMVQPDLYDTLVGKDAEAILSLCDTESKLKSTLDEILAQSQIPEIQKAIREQGLVRVRETLFIKIMTAINNVQITTNDGAKTQLQAAGVEKGWETNALKKELLEDTIKSLILSGIHYSTTGGWRFTLGYGKEGMSKSGRTLRSRGVGGGVIVGGEGVKGFLSLSGEVAEQYNYKNVINADLSDLKKAEYFGVEGGPLASVGSDGVSAEVYAGLTRHNNPEIGINQIDKQYRAVSAEIFNIKGNAPTTLSGFSNEILGNIQREKAKQPYGKFVTNNEKHLNDDVAFMVRYMDANKFFGDNGILKKHPEINTASAINSLLDIIQSGNIESRRHDVIAALHGKVVLTKLSFGVTTNSLTYKFGSGESGAPTGTGTGGETTDPGNITTGQGGDEGGSGNSGKLDADRFGIAGFYIGLRISTWKNIYVPNEAQYLFTQYEVGQGIGTEYIDNPAKDLDTYGKYLEAIYNLPKEEDTKQPENKLVCQKDATSNKLIITFIPNAGSDLTLAKFLNIHAKTDAVNGFSLRGNTLTIGNVGDIGVYTITEAQGVRRILSLGSKKIDETSRVTGDAGSDIVEPMKLDAHNVAWTQKKITEDIFNKMSGGPNVENAKKETSSFFDSSCKLIKPANTTVTFENVVEGQTLTTGTLTILKRTDGTYLVKLDTQSPTDKLTVTYKDEKEYTTILKDDIKLETNWIAETEISPTDIQKEFVIPTNISAVFVNQTERAVSIFDDYNQTLYREFMESAVSIGIDSFIDATDYTKAFNALKKILKNNRKYNKLTDLKTLIENPDLTKKEKMLIVDKFKTIFSYLTHLTDGKNDGKNLAELIKHRTNKYTTMKGPNGQVYPITTDYRKTILDNLKSENELTRTPVPNLVGLTAFYRLQGEGRKYAMTPLGGTNVLAGSDLETSMMTLNQHDKEKAQDRFINNLDVNKDNRDMIVEKLVTLLNAKNIPIIAEELGPKLGDFLKSPELIIHDLGIDSFKKITIDINRVFYLLGECGNESLGMLINDIKISILKPDVAGISYTASGTPDKSYTGGMDLNIKSHSIASKVLTQEKKAGIRHHHTKGVNIPIGKGNAGETTGKGEIIIGPGGDE